MDSIDLFHPNTFRILKAVCEEPGLMKSDIVKKAGSTSAINRLCKILVAERYLDEKLLGRYNKKSYTITDKGRMILAKMQEINEIDQGIYDDSENRNASDKKTVDTVFVKT